MQTNDQPVQLWLIGPKDKPFSQYITSDQRVADAARQNDGVIKEIIVPEEVFGSRPARVIRGMQAMLGKMHDLDSLLTFLLHQGLLVAGLEEPVIPPQPQEAEIDLNDGD